MNKAAEEGEREGGEEPEEEEEDQGVFSISGGNNIDDEGGRHNVPRAFTAGTQEAALDRWKRRISFFLKKTFLLFFSVLIARRASAASSSSALSYLSNGVFSFGDDFSLDGKSAVATTDADNVEDNHLKPTSAVQVMTKSPGPNSARYRSGMLGAIKNLVTFFSLKDESLLILEPARGASRPPPPPWPPAGRPTRRR